MVVVVEDVVDDVELVVVDVEPVVVVVVVVELVVVVHGWVTVTVVGWVTVTVTVFVLRFELGHAPSLSPCRRCAFTALFETTIDTSFFEPVRWHITTFFGFFFAAMCGPAIATDAPSPSTKTTTSAAFSFILTPLVGREVRRLPFESIVKPAYVSRA